MSELIQMMQEQNKAIANLTTMVGQLMLLVMKDKVDTTWVDESIAAGMLGYTDARSLRTNVKSGRIPIGHRDTNGRFYQYSRKDIMSFKKITGKASNLF